MDSGIPSQEQSSTNAFNDNPNRKSIKVWSDTLQRYYYKSKDPEYYNNYFHKTKHPMTCEVCGKTVSCQMYSHLKSNKCQLKRKDMELEKLKKELETIKQQEDVNV